MPSCVARVSVGEFMTSTSDDDVGSIAFARPKSSTLTVPSGRTFTLAGLRSRWTMPCSCAASSAVGDLPCDRQGLGERNRSLLDAIGKRRAVDQLHDERMRRAAVFEAVDLGDVRMIERGEDLRFAMKAREPIRVAGERIRQDLQRDVATELGVAGAIHLAHSALRPACPARDTNQASCRSSVERVLQNR